MFHTGLTAKSPLLQWGNRKPLAHKQHINEDGVGSHYYIGGRTDTLSSKGTLLTNKKPIIFFNTFWQCLSKEPLLDIDDRANTLVLDDNLDRLTMKSRTIQPNILNCGAEPAIHPDNPKHNHLQLVKPRTIFLLQRVEKEPCNTSKNAVILLSDR